MTRRLPAVLALCLLLFPLSSRAQAEELIPRPSASYTADQRIETGGEIMEARIAVDGVKQRSVQIMSGVEVVTIVLPEENRFYMVMPAMSAYVSMEVQEEMGGGTPEMNLNGMEAELIGEEEKNGEDTLVFLITDQGGVEGTSYITEDGIMVHFTSTDRQGNVMTIDRYNIHESPPMLSRTPAPWLMAWASSSATVYCECV